MDRYRLIAEIRKRPALWDAQSVERSRLKIADLWREVASNVGGDFLREPSKQMDRYRLIAEIRKRPALWDAQSVERSRLKIADLWREVASNVGGDFTIEACKCKWKHLRDAYRTEMKRAQHRIDRDIRKGKYDPNKDYGSKWQYYELMKFVDIGTKTRNRGYKSNDNDSDQGSNFNNSNNTNNDSQLRNTYLSSPPPLRKFNTVKINTTSYSRPPKGTYYQINFLENPDKEEELPMRSTSCHREDSEDNSCTNDHETSKDIPALDNIDNISIKEEPNNDIELDSYRLDNEEIDDSHSKSYHKENSPPPLSKRPRLMEKISVSAYQRHRDNNTPPTNSHNCRDETEKDQSNSRSMQDNITHGRSSIDIGDPDTNFLVSFSLHMKSMSQLQNLQFRAKMSELILSILSNSLTTNVINNQENNSKSKAFVDIVDPDCNFLISYLPHLKSMSQLQNLQFRAKMSDLMLNILMPSLTVNGNNNNNNALSDSTTAEGISNNLA